MKQIVILTLLLGLGCTTPEKTKEGVKETMKTGFYFPRYYLEHDSEIETPVAGGYYITQVDNKTTVFDIYCTECLPMGNNETTITEITDSFEDKFKYVSDDLQPYLINSNDTLYFISSEKLERLNKCQYDYIYDKLTKTINGFKNN